jgi:glutamate-1-semialdehyde 2,1-aminomutase
LQAHEAETATTDYGLSIEAHRRASLVIPGGVNSVFRGAGDPCPLTFVRGFGSHVVDVDGHDYVDYALGMGPLLLGHTPRAVVKAVTRAAAVGQLFAGQHPMELEVAELVLRAVPGADRIRFGQSGTEMDQLAIRLARAYTGRQRVVRFAGHYHGWLDPLYIAAEVESDGSPTLSRGQSRAASNDLIVLPWNDLDALRELFRRRAAEVAAVVMEPILCNTGVILPKPGYLEGARELASRAGALLIFDEVITGFRVDLGGAQTLLGVRPDLATFAKAMASGYPVAAIAGRAEVMDLLDEGGVVHGGTYNTGLSAMAAALATLETLIRDNPYPALYETGNMLMSGIARAATEVGVQLSVEGLGPVFHTRFGQPGSVTDSISFDADSDVEARRVFVRALQDRGVRITARGTWFLSTSHTDDDVAFTIEAVKSALKEVGEASLIARSLGA